jgi:tRNA uridine 5-carboxymethylaminomethyl modification enzyme
MITYAAGSYQVVVIGAGHAGCEAALASARMGCSTLLVTLSMENIALMPCNPSIGGPAKAQLVREIDALGGELGVNIDKANIQVRTVARPQSLDNAGEHGGSVQVIHYYLMGLRCAVS